MRSLKNFNTVSLVLILSFGFTACSGGGGGGDATPNSSGPTSVTHSGVAIDGILIGSTVCIDVDKSNSCDAGEPSAITDANGKFEIEATTQTGPLLLIGGIDQSTNQAFTGSLKAPAGSKVVTPLTSAVQSLVESGKSAAEAEANVKTAMGLRDVNLTTFDPYENINHGSAAQKATAKKVLAKQTQLQVLVHSATVTVAGADASTDVNSTMGSVFDTIAENFSNATGAVTLDATVMSAVTKKAADKVYSNPAKKAALISAKAVAQTSAESSVLAADSANNAILNGEISNALNNLDDAIQKVNTVAETELRAAAVKAKKEADKLTAAKIEEIEALQKAQEEKEAENAAAKVAQKKAEEELAAAKAAAEADAADRAKYQAYLEAQTEAANKAALKAEADKAAAQAQEAAASEEKAIVAEAAQREADAQAAAKQAEKERLAAEAEKEAAQKVADTFVSNTNNNIPVANANIDQNVNTTATVTLDGSTSSDANSDSLTYKWSITSKPTGSTATLSDATVAKPIFTADVDGAYVFSLVVNDGTIDSLADTVTVTATTANSAPVANAGTTQNIATTSTVTLNGSASSDANSNSLTYSWSLTSIPSGSNATLTNFTSVNPTFIADLDGSYIAQLIVNDGTVNSVADTVTIIATTILTPPAVPEL